MIKQFKLGDICDIQSGGTPSRSKGAFYGGTIPWAKISDLDHSHGPLIHTEEYISESGLKAIRGRLFPKGALLFAIYGSLGKMAFAGTALAANQAILGIMPKREDTIYLRYLYHFLKSRINELQAHGRGVTQKNLSASYLRTFEIPLPSYKEQEKLAAILDRADSIQQKRDQMLTLAGEFIGSAFLEMFGDPVANPYGWPTHPLSKLATFVSGATPSKSREDYWVGSFPWVSPKDMKKLVIDDAQDHVSGSVFSETNLKKIPRNTVLIVVRGMILAHTVPIGITGVEVTINQDLKAIVFDTKIDPLFGLWCLKVQHASLLSKVDTAAHGTKRFDLDRLGSVPIIEPTRQAQRQFVSVVQKFSSFLAYSESVKQEETMLAASLAQFCLSPGSVRATCV